jgi:hypothetical protein
MKDYLNKAHALMACELAQFGTMTFLWVRWRQRHIDNDSVRDIF